MKKASPYFLALTAPRSQVETSIHVFGPAGSGKSTLVEQLHSPSDDAIAAPKTKLKKTHLKEPKTGYTFVVSDFGGDPMFRSLWFEGLRNRPLGLIYVVDQRIVTNAVYQSAALEGLHTIRGHIEFVRERNQIQTRALLLFLNKWDEWKGEIDPRLAATILKTTVDEFRRLAIQPIMRWGSAKYGLQYESMLKQTMSDFCSLLSDDSVRLPYIPPPSDFYETIEFPATRTS